MNQLLIRLLFATFSLQNITSLDTGLDEKI